MYVTWNRTLAGNVIQYQLQVMMTLSESESESGTDDSDPAVAQIDTD